MRQVMTSLSKRPAPNPKIDRVTEVISNHIARIKLLFIPGSIVSVIVRQPGDEAGDFDLVVSNDDMDELAKVIERAKTREAF